MPVEAAETLSASSNVSTALVDEAASTKNEVGQEISRKTLIHAGGSATENFEIEHNLPAGHFQLSIKGNNFKTSVQLIKN